MTSNGLLTRAVTFAGTTVRIDFTPGRAAGVLDFLFGAPTSGESADRERPARLRLSENPATGDFTVLHDEVVRCVDRSAGAVASWVLHMTCRQLADEGEHGLLLHAGAVAWNGRGLLLAGASGAGKSTLTAFLTSLGFVFLTDELVHVPPAASHLEGFTVPLKIKKPGREALAGRVALEIGTPGIMEGVGDILVRPESAPAGPAPLAAILFPRYRARSRFRLHPLPPVQAGLRLLAGAVNAASLPDRGFREVTRVAGLVPSYELRYANLAQVSDHLDDLRRLALAPSEAATEDVHVGAG